MVEIPLGWLLGALAVLLGLSAFFSIAETAMMAINRSAAEAH
jgi:Mg2+/Co2+ transporter CorB